MEQKPIKISGTIMWAFLARKNELASKYTFDLCNLSDAAVKALEDAGVEVKHKDDKGYFIVYKSLKEIGAYDKNGNTLDNTVVGNGSKAVVVTSFYETKFKNKKWIQPSCMKLVITELKEYSTEGAPVDVDDDEVL